LAALLLFLVLTLVAQTPQPLPTFLPYAEARPIMEALADILPEELKVLSVEEREATWPGWVRRRNAEIRDRLAQGDEDSIVNLLLFGTSFTRHPRATEADLLRMGPGGAATIIPDRFGKIVMTRADDFLRALRAPATNERLAFARQVIQQKGYTLATPEGIDETRRYLLFSVLRVLREQANYQAALEEARRLGDPTEEFAQRSRLYAGRGLSLDTTLRPNFALEQSLERLKQDGWLGAGGVKRVAVVGPGLDFVDKEAGYDFYPEQTIQPFAIMDSLLRLNLADAQALEVTTLDLSPRVNTHIRRARQGAAAGTAYTLQLPLDVQAGWHEKFIEYWKHFGDKIGTAAKPAPLPGGLDGVAIRAVRVPPRTVLRIRPVDLNAVLQRLEGADFDLIVATNILIYYDTFEQTLALANIERMLRPGGLLLSNNALLELPFTRMRSVGYRTTVYSSRPDDGDHIVWYQRISE
jgi:SAM-dependent methyltransferase